VTTPSSRDMGALLSPHYVRAIGLAGAALLLCSGCEDPTCPETLSGVVKVSETIAWDSSCTGPTGGGVLRSNTQVEAHVAIDPRDPKHLIGSWQQDRWSNGGANGVLAAVTFDGGHTWSVTAPKLSRCTGGTYDRATDPWLTISPNGIAYHIGYVFDWSAPNRAMLVSRSTDGGRTWSDPIALQADTSGGVIMDKETITADPLDPNYVFAVWNRLTVHADEKENTGPAWFARTTDGGVTWETARQIYDPGPDTQTVSNQIVVLPDGTLLDLLLVLTENSSLNARATVAVLRSTDRGVSWSPTHISIAESEFVGVNDPKNGRGIRSGNVVPNIAVDRAKGTLYVVWEDARFSGMERDGIVLSTSTDGGLTWSMPVRVNGAPGAGAFTPTVAVAGDGTLGVTYYDTRNDRASDSDHLMVTHWLATSKDGGATFSDTMIGAPFDLRHAAMVEGQAYFLGDYQGLVHDGSAFLPFFAASCPSNVFFRPAGTTNTTGSALSAAAESVQQLWRGARERWRFGTLFK
jgi:BNR repeat-like domain